MVENDSRVAEQGLSCGFIYRADSHEELNLFFRPFDKTASPYDEKDEMSRIPFFLFSLLLFT